VIRVFYMLSQAGQIEALRRGLRATPVQRIDVHPRDAEYLELVDFVTSVDEWGEGVAAIGGVPSNGRHTCVSGSSGTIVSSISERLLPDNTFVPPPTFDAPLSKNELVMELLSDRANIECQRLVQNQKAENQKDAENIAKLEAIGAELGERLRAMGIPVYGAVAVRVGVRQ
jgi:hypothetical protein